MASEAPELEPPWTAYPGQPPWWGGWRQGTSEAWLHDQWLPFWHAKDAAAREAYLVRWPPPDEDWREYLMQHWAGGVQ